MKNIIFDLGNVLINYDFELFFERLGYQRGERSLKEAHDVIFAFECGKMGIDDFLIKLKRVYNSKLEIGDFREAWCDVFWANDELLDMIPELRKNYRLMILSNNDELHFPYIWDKFRKLHVFEMEDIMITSRLGYLKPDQKVYEEAVRQHGFEWQESLFIDDVKINTEIAQKFGAETIWHQNNIDTMAAIKEFIDKDTI